MSKTNRRNARFAVSAIAIAIAAPAMQANAALEEIIVSARKTDETLQEVPVAVTAFNAETMQQMNVVQTSDISKFTPSVFIEPPAVGNATSAKVTIRGQNQSDSLITLDPSVGWYLDDIYLARAYGTVASLFDAERVEVLKGPQGTLYGRNTTGGAVKIVTTKADPSGDISGYVTGGIGNYDARKIGGAINIPLIDNVLGLRLVALKDKADGWGTVNLYSAPSGPWGPGPTATTPASPAYVANSAAAANPTFLGKKDAGFRDTEMYRANLTWLAADNVEVQFGYEHSELDVSTLQRNIRAPYDALPSAGIPATTNYHTANLQVVPRSKAESDTVNLNISYDINEDLNTKLIYGWRRVISSYHSDIDGGAWSINNFYEPADQWARQQSLEWQISGTAAQDMLDWMTGIYLFEEQGHDETRSNGLLTSYATGHAYGRAENESKSMFVNGTLHLTDKLNFTGGLRYSKDDKPLYKRNYLTESVTERFVACNLNATTPNFNLEECSSTAHGSYEFISWQAGFDYTITDGMMAYIKSGKASRSGGQNVRGTTGDTSVAFQPESATDIEIGFKSQLFDNQVRFNADVFHTFYEDIQQSQIFTGPSGSFTRVGNAAQADLDGFEFELTVAVVENLTATATGSLINWDFKDDMSILPSVPAQQYSVRLDYVLPIPIGTVNFSTNYSWHSEYLGNGSSAGRPIGGPRQAIRELDELTVDSLGLLGARIALNMEDIGVTVAVWGNNLTDEEYYSSPLHFPYSANIQAPIINGTIGEPRTFGLDVTKKF
jgi:iron complex outermembrane receptor protein